MTWTGLSLFKEGMTFMQNRALTRVVIQIYSSSSLDTENILRRDSVATRYVVEISQAADSSL
jgi:hypothetical protein